MDPEQELLAITGTPTRTSGNWDFLIPLPIKKSSCIAAAAYALGTGELILTFVSGATAAYKLDVVTVLRFVKADSPGSFYNAEIRGR